MKDAFRIRNSKLNQEVEDLMQSIRLEIKNQAHNRAKSPSVASMHLSACLEPISENNDPSDIDNKVHRIK